MVCVSGWCDAYAQLGLEEAARIVAIHRLLSAIFPDRGWFTAHARVISDTDHRCRAIDLSEDWWYVDDWADKFFGEAFGAREYERWLGSRILRCDPYGDGSDIVEWLKGLPGTDRGPGQAMASER